MAVKSIPQDYTILSYLKLLKEFPLYFKGLQAISVEWFRSLWPAMFCDSSRHLATGFVQCFKPRRTKEDVCGTQIGSVHRKVPYVLRGLFLFYDRELCLLEFEGFHFI